MGATAEGAQRQDARRNKVERFPPPVPGSVVRRASYTLHVLSIGDQWTVQAHEKRAFSVGAPNTLARGGDVGLFEDSKPAVL